MESQELVLPRHGFVRDKVLLQFIPFGRSTLWQKAKEGSFPAPQKLSDGVTAWRCEDIWRWMESQKQVTKPRKPITKPNNRPLETQQALAGA